MEEKQIEVQETTEQGTGTNYLKIALYAVVACILFLIFVGAESCDCQGDKCTVKYSLLGKITPLENLITWTYDLDRQQELFIRKQSRKGRTYYALFREVPSKPVQQVVFQKIHFADYQEASEFVQAFHGTEDFVIKTK